jgi:hypothetical protein
MLAQVLYYGHTIAEVSCPTKYFAEASSINFKRSTKYGFGCLGTAITYRLAKWRLLQTPLFPPAREMPPQQALPLPIAPHRRAA